MGDPRLTTRARPAARLPESAARRRGARSHASEPSPEFGGADAGDDARAPLGSVCGYTHVWRCCPCSLRLPLEGFGIRIGVGGADIDRASGPVPHNASLLSRPHSEAHPNEVYLLRPWHSLLTRITTSPTSRTSSCVPSPVPSRARAARASRASPRRDPVTPRRSAPHAPPAPRAEPQGRQVVRHAPLARRAASRRFRPPRAPRAPRRNRDAAYPEVAAGPPKPPPPPPRTV